MKINRARLHRLLIPFGYSRVPFESVRNFSFVRVFPGDPATHWIDVASSGKCGEAVYAYVGVAVTKRVAIKGLTEIRPLCEIGEVKERGWTIIEDAAAARAWEDKLVEYAPAMAAAFAAEKGPELLRQTASARAAVAKYLERLPEFGDNLDRVNALRRNSTGRMLAEAQSLAEGRGVQQFRGTEDEYLLTCLAITLFAPEVEPDGRSFFGEIPWDNQELMLRIQIMADELIYLKELA